MLHDAKDRAVVVLRIALHIISLAISFAILASKMHYQR